MFKKTGSFITVRWDVVGFHSYPYAPEEVAFLRERHRHNFKCAVTVEVFHDDRELEFFMLQNRLKEASYGLVLNMQSCEWLAGQLIERTETIISQLGAANTPRAIIATVSEDGENEGVVKGLIFV